MKKIFLSLILTVILLLTGCTVRTYYFNYDEMAEKVVKIDIIDIPISTRRSDGISEPVIGSLDDELIDDFLLDLSKIEFTRPWGISNPRFPEGVAFLIYYSDNSYDIINESSTYSQENIVEIWCPIEDYNNLVNKYYCRD